jgi:hypothetical protein
MALINLVGYKIYAGIKSSNYDDELTTLIVMATQFARNYCRRTFDQYVSTPAVELVDGGTDLLLLTESPLIDVISVEYSEDYGQTFTALTEFEDWVQIEDAVQSTSTTGFPYKLNGYRISYYAGYSTAPADLQLALCELVTYFRKNDNALHAPRTVGSSSNAIEYVTGNKLPSNIKMVLDFYKADYL